MISANGIAQLAKLQIQLTQKVCARPKRNQKEKLSGSKILANGGAETLQMKKLLVALADSP